MTIGKALLPFVPEYLYFVLLFPILKLKY